MNRGNGSNGIYEIYLLINLMHMKYKGGLNDSRQS